MGFFRKPEVGTGALLPGVVSELKGRWSNLCC